jgi:hypothetical protein
MEYSDTPISVLANTMPVTDIYFTSATISAKEKANQYLLAASEALDSTRYAPFYNKKEIGSIEGVAGNTIRLKIKD